MNRIKFVISGTFIMALVGMLLADEVASKSKGSEISANNNAGFHHDIGSAVGPAKGSGLQFLGQLRVRRSEEINGTRWGVCCHWIADEHPLNIEKRLELLSAVGAKWAFLCPDWDKIEQKKGKYKWNTPSHRFDDVVNGLIRRKITPVIQIYGGNQLYMQAGPDSNKRQLADAAKLLDDPEVSRAWHRFLEALVSRYREHVKVWEVWNEPNGPYFWKTEPSAKDYGRVVKVAAAIIKRIQPEAVILAGSTANVPLDYLDSFLTGEGTGSFDHWSVHPYGELPEARDAAIRKLQELLRARGKSSAIWQSECGFPSSADTGGWGFGGPWDETKHAKWVLRRLLSDASLGMPVSIYFVLYDYPARLEGGPDKDKMGINRKGLYWFGSWERKPAAHAFAYLSSLIDDRFETVNSSTVGFEITVNGSLTAPKTELIKTCLLKNKSNGQSALVYWLGVPMETNFQPARVTVSWPSGELTQPVLVDLMDGGVYALHRQQQNGQIKFENIPLADSPLVICNRDMVELKQ